VAKRVSEEMGVELGNEVGPADQHGACVRVSQCGTVCEMHPSVLLVMPLVRLSKRTRTTIQF
jgi:hypothetical protein